jgi:hypothetical protein
MPSLACEKEDAVVVSSLADNQAPFRMGGPTRRIGADCSPNSSRTNVCCVTRVPPRGSPGPVVVLSSTPTPSCCVEWRTLAGRAPWLPSDPGGAELRTGTLLCTDIYGSSPPCSSSSPVPLSRRPSTATAGTVQKGGRSFFFLLAYPSGRRGRRTNNKDTPTHTRASNISTTTTTTSNDNDSYEPHSRRTPR